MSPQGCRVVSFKAPTATELAHDYLWRVHAQLPARGELAIFNRSHYEDIVAVRMWELAPEEVWRRRPGHIRDWERMLIDEGTTIVKVFLNVSKDEQRKRLQERIDTPEKRWKFRRADLEARRRFDDYIAAYEEAITETSTDWAPWYVVPADRNWVKAVAVAELLVDDARTARPAAPGGGARHRIARDRVKVLLDADVRSQLDAASSPPAATSTVRSGFGSRPLAR